MTITTGEIAAQPGLVRTARITGSLYLGLALTGALSFLVVRGQLYVVDDPGATLANLVEHPSLARTGLALEMAVVVTQALTALGFYRLFRRVDSFAAGTIAAFGLVNAAAVMVSASLIATALDASSNPTLAASGDAASTAQLMYVASDHLWGVGAIFFGLWLIPMGWLVVRSQWMPRPMGWILMAGGVGYVVGAFARYLLPDPGATVDLLTVPATIGEVWILGYLIIVGVRPRTATHEVTA